MTLLALCAVGALMPPARLGVRPPPPSAGRAAAVLSAAPAAMPLERLEPLPTLEPREVIASVMAALHRSNWDSPTAFYGFEVALRFLAPTHPAKVKRAKPSGFSRFMRQPHKIQQISWSEYRFEGDLVLLPGEGGRDEAFQMVSMRSGPTDDWMSARWKLVKAQCDYGESVTPLQWMVEAVFAAEPDTAEDIEFLRAHAPEASPEGPAPDSARAVVEKVMRALRTMDDPTPFHGAMVATRYCSPRNRASELSPQVFAQYLKDPWYAILSEWDEMVSDEDEVDEEGSIEVMVRREGEGSSAMVAWELSMYDGQWLIDSLNIIS